VVIGRVLRADQPLCAPLPVRVLGRVPALQKVPARLVGVGLRPERLGPERMVTARRVEA
jgi:hypothetical protein